MGNVTYHFYTNTEPMAKLIVERINQDINGGQLEHGEVAMRKILKGESNTREFYAVTLKYDEITTVHKYELDKYFESQKDREYMFYDGWDSDFSMLPLPLLG